MPAAQTTPLLCWCARAKMSKATVYAVQEENVTTTTTTTAAASVGQNEQEQQEVMFNTTVAAAAAAARWRRGTAATRRRHMIADSIALSICAIIGVPIVMNAVAVVSGGRERVRECPSGQLRA